jgi:hypothetical protein
MSSLLKKQWRENRLYLALFLAWMLLAAVYCVSYELAHQYHASIGQFSGFALFYSVFAAIFLAMRTAQGEQAAGTLSFTASLPISLRRVAAVRLAGAIVTLAVPILVAAALLSCALASGVVDQVEPRDGTYVVQLQERDVAPLLTSLEQTWSVAAIASLGGLELMLVLCVLGCWLRGQARVGLLGAVLGFGSLIAGGLLWYGPRRPLLQMAYGALMPQSLIIQWGFGAVDGGFYTDHELAVYRWPAMGLAIPLLVGLGSLFLLTYGTQRPHKSDSNRQPGRFRLPSILPYLPFQLPGRLATLVWLELRQSVPLAVCGLLLAGFMALSSVLIEPRQGQSLGDSWFADMPAATWVVASLWAVVVGATLYGSELGTRLGAFWRSRPISPRMWFWTKYVIGLFAVLSVLDGVTILLTWNAPRDTPTTGMSWAYIVCVPLLHAFLYTLSVLGTCWTRRPVAGGFLAIGVFALISMVLTTFPATSYLDPINIYNSLLRDERAGGIDLARHGYPLVYGLLLAATLFLSWLSSRLARPLSPALRWLMAASA